MSTREECDIVYFQKLVNTNDDRIVKIILTGSHPMVIVQKHFLKRMQELGLVTRTLSILAILKF